MRQVLFVPIALCLRDRAWEQRQTFLLMRQPEGFLKFDSISFPLIGSNQSTTHMSNEAARERGRRGWGRSHFSSTQWGNNERKPRRDLCVSLTLCQGLTCMNPPRTAWVTGQFPLPYMHHRDSYVVSWRHYNLSSVGIEKLELLQSRRATDCP